TDPLFKVEVVHVPETGADSAEAKELARALRSEVAELVKEAGGALAQLELDENDPSGVADRIAALLDMPTPNEIELLAETDVPTRIRLLVKRIGEAKAQAEIRAKIETEVKKELGKNQREHVLREQMRAIQRELGEGGDDDLTTLKKRLDEA